MADGRAYSYSGKAMMWPAVVTIATTLVFVTLSVDSIYTDTLSVSVKV